MDFSFNAWNEVQLFSFFFVLIRIGSILVFLPIFGEKFVPPTVKILFALSLSVVIFPTLWVSGIKVPSEVLKSTENLVIKIVTEVSFGALLGWVARWIFDAVQFAGYITSTSLGFSLATILDPHTDSQTTALSQLQYGICVLLFLALEGHLLYVQCILDSFQTVGLAQVNFFANTDKVVQYLIGLSGDVLVLAIRLAAPAMIVVLLLNLTFGLLARAVPQMNALSVSFAANILVGLFVVFLSFPGFSNLISSTIDQYSQEMHTLLRLLRG